MRKIIDAINNKFGDINPFIGLGIIMTASYIWEVVK